MRELWFTHIRPSQTAKNEPKYIKNEHARSACFPLAFITQNRLKINENTDKKSTYTRTVHLYILFVKHIEQKKIHNLSKAVGISLFLDNQLYLDTTRDLKVQLENFVSCTCTTRKIVSCT